MKFTVSERHEGVRLSSFLKGTAKVSATLLPRLKRGRILVNGALCHVNYHLHIGDEVTLLTEEETSVREMLAKAGADFTEVLYEDGDVLVLKKPAGMPTHPSAHHMEDSFATRLGEVWGGTFHPVSRLDADTTGALLLAKNAYAAARLCRAMQQGRVEKTYIAVTEQAPLEKEGRLVHYTKPDPAHPSRRALCAAGCDGAKRNETEYCVLAEGKGLFLWECRPITGRTHQIRVQLAAVRCPILGDAVYGTESSRISRHALHAKRIVFPHPTKEKTVTVECPVPADMMELVNECDSVFEKN